MEKKKFVVMGAGEVGFHMARELSREGHDVVVIERDAGQRERVEELDVAMVTGNGAHLPVLEAARVGSADLFMAVSSNDEANLAASLLARRLGAKRAVVRVGEAEDITRHRRTYEESFRADLLLSTQLLATTRILNHILGHNTVAVEYLARGKVQLRKVRIERGSVLTRRSLAELAMPQGSLVVALFRGAELVVPSGEDLAESGDDALILGKTEVIDGAERLLAHRPRTRGTVVIGGGGKTGETVARALAGQVDRLRIIESDRRRASELAGSLPDIEVLYGDATDLSLLRAENVAAARAFVALTGNDERNLMASLLAQDLGMRTVIALVERTETSHLWRKLGQMQVVSPRQIASQRILRYIESGYSANIVSLRHGAAQVLERRLAAASPAAGVTLAEMKAPRGLIVGAVVRGERVFVPRGKDRLEIGDTVVLFVAEEHVPTVQLLFPGQDPDC